MDWASGTQTTDLSSIPGRVKPKPIKIGIQLLCLTLHERFFCFFFLAMGTLIQWESVFLQLEGKN